MMEFPLQLQRDMISLPSGVTPLKDYSNCSCSFSSEAVPPELATIRGDKTNRDLLEKELEILSSVYMRVFPEMQILLRYGLHINKSYICLRVIMHICKSTGCVKRRNS